MKDKFIMLSHSMIRDKNLTMQEKIFLMEIVNLTSTEVGCVASNEHFEKCFGVSKKSASNTINSLVKKGYIDSKISDRNHKRILSIKDGGVSTKDGESKDNITPNRTLNRTFNKKNNTKKDFSFSLSKSSQYENLSEEYKELLAGYATCKDGAYSLDEFLDYHIAKGSKFKDWSRAYNTWINNAKKYNNYEPNKYLDLFAADVTGLKIDTYARYGTDKLYDPKSLKIVATYKRDNRQQQAGREQEESNPMAMEMMKSLANSVRVS